MNHKPKIKHVIFDWSGTLFDDFQPGFLATKHFLKELCGTEITLAEYQEHFTIPIHPFYLRYGITLPFDEIERLFFKTYSNYLDQGVLFSHVKEMLQLLRKQGIGVSLFSTVKQDVLEYLLVKSEIASWIDFVRGSARDKRQEMKSHLHEIGMRPQDVLFIGDMDHDVEAGKVNGMLSGCITTGYHDLERLAKQRPDYIWSDQKEWLSFFGSLNSENDHDLLESRQETSSPIATSGSLVLNQKNQVLLVLTQKWNHTYGIPGGKIEKGETAEAAAMREVFEETGLKTEIKEFIMVQDCIHPAEYCIPNSHFLLFNYLAETSDEKVTLNHESLSSIWIDPFLALNIRLNEPTRVLLNKYLQASQS